MQNTGALDTTAGLDREQGYKRAILECGLPLGNNLIVLLRLISLNQGDITPRKNYWKKLNMALSLPVKLN